MDLPSDLIDLLSAFADEQVEYLLIGERETVRRMIRGFRAAASPAT